VEGIVMVSFFGRLRKAAAGIIALAGFVGLAACDPAAFPTAAAPLPAGGGAVQVALLVPSGSGRPGDEILSRSLENAARLAVQDLGGQAIDLRVYSTGGSPAQAAAAATRAVDEGAGIILGPVFADATNAAGVAVRGRGVNVLSFSNNTDIAGGNVFVLGNTFQNTANRLVSFAARRGKGRILVVHEQNAAGAVGRRAIESAIANSNATLAGSVGYPFSQEDVVAAVPRIAEAVRSNNAQSVFLTADSVGALPFFAQLLPEAGIRGPQTQFIGLTRWDIPPATLQLPGVQGGWFALPDPRLNAQFQARYQAAYGGAPHPIAGLAYDGIAAIGALVRRGRGDPFSTAALTQPSGFVGVNGVFRLRPDGTNERGLAVAEVRNNQVVEIDPAPRSFPGAGS
jgi:hypothetical protein